MKQYIVDAFTNKPFSGNPAAVCVMGKWPSDNFMIFNYFETDKDVIEFDTLSGKLMVTRKKNLYEMDFPTYEQEEISVTDDMERAFGVRPVKAILGPDPVCGSAHCQIADYWSKELGKSKIRAYQASKRGGNLYCELLNNGRISISGEATLVAISDIVDF